MNSKSSQEIIYGFTAEEAVHHLSKSIKEAKQRNRRFALRTLLSSRPMSKVDGAIAHRDVIGKASRIVNKLKANPELLQSGEKVDSKIRRTIAHECQALSDTMECIEMESSWESSAFKSLSNFLETH